MGVIESDGRAHRLIGSGVIRTSPKQPLSKRLLAIARGLREVHRSSTRRRPPPWKKYSMR